jgi:DNA-binding SARP family transcriptional activator/tetratricopeptide (TPR) repeat protein
MTRPAPTLSVRLLGPLEVSVSGRPIVVDTRKAMAIVALVAADGRPFARDELAAMFWPDADDEAARGALRRTLSALRGAVGDTGLLIDRTRVALDPDGAAIDLAEVERLERSEQLADLERAAALARGPFLAGFALRDSPAFDDWQAARAVRVERTVADLLDRLAEARLAAGDTVGAVEAAGRRVESDPLDEPGQRRLIELLARSGDRTGAIRQYRSLVAVFDRELGVAPLRETTELYESIRDDRRPTAEAPVEASGAGRHEAGQPPTVPRGGPMVGRDRELKVLVEAWHGVGLDGRLAVIEGEAGIGKTRLAEALAESVRGAGGVVLAARGYPGEAGIAYGPIVELIRAGLARSDGIERLHVLDATARLELSRLIDLPVPLRVPGRPGPETVSARVRLLDAIADSLAALGAGKVPGLVWIDDLHLADEPTREAVVYLARRLTGRRIVLVVAWRREDLSDAGLASAVDLERIPGVVVVSLGRLDRPAVAKIVRTARREPADEAFIDAVTEESEGLPLYLVQALAASDPSDVTIRGGVEGLLRDRIGSVGQIAAQVLSGASVIGRSFDLATVGHTSGRSDEETIEALEELIRRGLVREVPDGSAGTPRYDFSHGRLRDAAYEATSLGRRRLLHARTADALRLDLAGTGREDLARWALIALHEREAGRPGPAAEAFLDAADRAQAAFANREAIDHLRSAIALGRPDAGELHGRIGALLGRLGEYPAAIAELETAAALADPAALPGVEISLGRIHRRRGDLTTAASHLEAALAAPTLEPPTRVRALVERSMVALRAGDLATAAAAAEAARTGAQADGDRHGVGVAERLVGMVAHARGDHAAARAALERSLALASDDPDPMAAIAAETALALAMAADGAVDEAIRTATAAIERCRLIGDRHLEAAVENHLADLLHAAGRAEASMDHLKRAVALFAEVGERTSEPEPGIWALAAW